MIGEIGQKHRKYGFFAATICQWALVINARLLERQEIVDWRKIVKRLPENCSHTDHAKGGIEVSLDGNIAKKPLCPSGIAFLPRKAGRPDDYRMK